MKKLFAAACLPVLLAGCATTPPAPYQVDHTYTSKSQSDRVKFVIIHYTVSDTPGSIRTLTQEVVSSHYLLTDEDPPKLYGLVDESRVANHAGVSNWKNYSLLNPSSIGIEIVNRGWVDTPQGRQWFAFPQRQMDILIPLLKDIVARHHIAPENILGHADIAPGRKQDPGALFPWKQLADAGLIPWPNPQYVATQRPYYEQQLPDVVWFQKKLAAFGYAVPQTGVLDKATQNVITTFQMKYRQANIDGVPDAETAAILDVMTPTTVVPLVNPVPVPACCMGMNPAAGSTVAPVTAPAPAPSPAPAAQPAPATEPAPAEPPKQ